MRYYFAPFAIALLLSACASTPVTLAPGQAPGVSEFLRERWLPAATQAQQRYRTLMRERAGLSSVRTVPVVLAYGKADADKAIAAQADAHVSMLNSSFPDVLTVRSVVDPVRASARLLFTSLPRRSPAWLERGLSTQIALDVLRQEKGPNGLTERILRSDMEVELRSAKMGISVADVLQAEEASKSEKFLALADFMGEALRQRLGEGFYRSLPAYLRAIDSRATPDQAFQTAFGISLQAFGAEATQQLDALRAQQRSHLPTSEAFLDLDAEVGRSVLTTKRMRETFDRYAKQVAPKAFVRARSGHLVYFDDRPEALPLALEQCRTVDPLGCRVVAIDDRFVAPLRTAGANVDVHLASTGQDAWTEEVRTKWMPILRNTVDHFNQVVQKQLGHAIREDIRIHVVSNREDYAKVLRNELNLSSGSAERTAESSNGFANQNGQMLISLYERTSPEFLWEVAVTVTLHELAHELQGQLRGDRAGFNPPRWLDEASADHIANLVGKELQRDSSAKFAIQDWRESVIEWYRLRGKSLTKPEDVIEAASLAKWIDLVRDGRNPYQMSGIIAVHLADKLGSNYFPALLRYWALAAQEGEKEEQAFEKSFGMSKADFMTSLKKWLANL